jgi:hypothetical protein
MTINEPRTQLPDYVEEMIFESSGDLHEASCPVNNENNPDECDCGLRRLVASVYTYATAFTVAQRDEMAEAVAEKDSQLEALRKENERLIGLIKEWVRSSDLADEAYSDNLNRNSITAANSRAKAAEDALSLEVTE